MGSLPNLPICIAEFDYITGWPTKTNSQCANVGILLRVAFFAEHFMGPA